jgi:hypothetical protein
MGILFNAYYSPSAALCSLMYKEAPTKAGIIKYTLLWALAGTAIASAIAAIWYTPLAFNPAFTYWLERASLVVWPTYRMIGGWVGPADPWRYWFIVVRSIVANALVYAAIGAVIAGTMGRNRRFN